MRVGLGASRQDVNVSVRGGSRVEIKGVPQAALGAGLGARRGGAAGESVAAARRTAPPRIHGARSRSRAEHADVTELFAASPLAYLRREQFAAYKQESGIASVSRCWTVRSACGPCGLPGLAGTLSWPTQPELNFAHELAGRVKVIACLDQQPILLHSEKWPDYAGATQELRRLKDKVGCTADDAVVVVWGVERDTFVRRRRSGCGMPMRLSGVPPETRQPFADGSTFFERILPGPDRMYPDTDSPPQRIVRERVDAVGRRAARSALAARSPLSAGRRAACPPSTT